MPAGLVRLRSLPESARHAGGYGASARSGIIHRLCIRGGGSDLTRKARWIPAVAAMALLAACAGRSTLPSQLPQADPVAAELGQPEYRIGPNDLLSVSVFQVPDLDRDVRVNNAGQVSLPLVGVVAAAGRTVDELQADIAARYGGSFLQNPQVSVFIKEFASQRVTVEGAVKKSGIFPMTTSSLSLLQAVALAEGLSDTANSRNVFVFRNVGDKRMVARFDLKAIQEGRADDPRIQGEDVIVVDQSRGEVWLQNFIKLTPILTAWIYYARR
jgi:polysaccharide export outer membrane protein